MYILLSLLCPATWFHGPNGKNERPAIRSGQSIQSAVTTRAPHCTTTRAWLPWPGLWLTRSTAISSGNARTFSWRHGWNAIWSTGISQREMIVNYLEMSEHGLQLCFNTLFTLLDGFLWTAGPWRVWLPRAGTILWPA